MHPEPDAPPDASPGSPPDPAPAPAPEPIPPWPKRLLQTTLSGLDWLFGLVAIVLGLAILSIIPILNFLSLGYLVHASGRVATTGRLRDGLVGIRKASVIGSFALGTWLVLLPVRLVSGLWRDAELVAPGSPTAQAWRLGLLCLTAAAVMQIVWACFRGGRIRHFLWPAPIRFVRWLATPDKFIRIRAAVMEYLASLRLHYYFWLGARACLGAFLWLVVPVGILMAAAQYPPGKGGGLLSLIGAFLLMVVALYLPFLQARFAIENRFSALFAIRPVRDLFNRAPVAFWIALLVTLVFALPLYLLKIELPPRELAWLPSVFFVVFILPARLITGWAMARARRRRLPRHGFFRWTSRLAAIPVVFLYAVFVYLTQYLTWNGTLSLLEQHAFMVPAPLMNL